MFGVEKHARLPHIPGMELEVAEYISAHPKPVVSTAELIRLTTTNARGVFHNPGKAFGSERWSGLEDSLALSAVLGLIEGLDRRHEGSLDGEFKAEVFAEVEKAK